MKRSERMDVRQGKMRQECQKQCFMIVIVTLSIVFATAATQDIFQMFKSILTLRARRIFSISATFRAYPA